MKRYGYILITALVMAMGRAAQAQSGEVLSDYDIYCRTMETYGLPCNYQTEPGTGSNFSGYVAVPGFVEPDDLDSKEMLWCEYREATNYNFCYEQTIYVTDGNKAGVVAIALSDFQYAVAQGQVAEAALGVGIADDTRSLLVQMQGKTIASVYDQTSGYFARKTGYFVPTEDAFERGAINQAYWDDRTTEYEAALFSSLSPGYIQKLWSPVVGALMMTSSADVDWTAARTRADGYFIMPYGFYEEIRMPMANIIAMSMFSLAGLAMAGFYQSELVFDNACLYSPTIPVYAKVAYGNFNPRSAGPKYFTMATSGSDCNRTPHGNFPFDVIQFAGTLCMTNDSTANSCLSADLIPVPNMGSNGLPVGDPISTEYYPGQETGEAEAAWAEAGLVKHLHVNDFRDTDIFVYRASTGELMGVRSYITNLEIGDHADVGGVAYANFSTLLRGRQMAWLGTGNRLDAYSDALTEGYVENGEVVWDEQEMRYARLDADSGEYVEGWSVENPDLVAQHDTFAQRSLRVGEQVRIVAVNRSTGYIGTQWGKVKQPSPGSTLSLLMSGDLVLRPPNLKVNVWRAPKGEEENACLNPELTGDGVRVYSIGNRGSGMLSDECIAVQTKWYDRDGLPLPDFLPGYTGRLARLGGAQGSNGHFNDTSTLESGMAQFEIEPGTHLQMFRVLEDSDLGHYYIHIDGAAGDTFASFRSGEQDAPSFSVDSTSYAPGEQSDEEEYLKYRPADYVPFLVRNTTAVDEEGWGGIWYKHRPEFQFSLLSLKEVDIQALDENGDPVDTNTFLDDSGAVAGANTTDPLQEINLTYWLMQDDTDHGLPDDFQNPLNDDEGDLIFQMTGVESKNAVFANNLVGYNTATWNLPNLQVNDLLTLSLVEAHDPGNILWDLNPPRIKIKLRGNKTSIPSGGSEIAYVVETSGKVMLQDVTWEILELEEGVVAYFDENFDSAGDDEAFDKKISAGKESKEGCLVLKATATCTPDVPCGSGLVAYRIVKVGCECADCPDDVALEQGVDFEVKMGASEQGSPAGSLRLKDDSLDDMGTPAALQALNMGAEMSILRDDSDMLYQAQGPQKTADITVLSANSWRIAIYDNQYITGQQMVDGDARYTFTGLSDADSVWTITRESSTSLLIEKESKGITETYRYVLNGSEWLLEKGDDDAVQQLRETRTDSGGLTYEVLREVLDADGNPITATRERMYRLTEGDMGYEVPVERVDGVGLGETRTTSMDYVESGPNLGKLSFQQNPDGSWTDYSYNDSTGQLTQRADVWMGDETGSTQSKITSYQYHSDEAHKDRYQRLKATGPGGQVLYEEVFDYSGNEEEGYTMWNGRCAASGCTLGDASTQVTETEYFALGYPQKEGEKEAPWSGRVKRIVYPNGLAEYYEYDWAVFENGIYKVRENGDYTYETVTRGTDSSTHGVALRTTRDVLIYNALGKLVRQEKYVWTGSSYSFLKSTTNYYDNENHLIRTEYSDGTQIENFWGCCGQTSTTDRLGVQTEYVYDDLKRVEKSTQFGVGGQDDVVTEYTYDAAGRTLSTKVSAGMLSEIASSTYDHFGRVLTSKDEAGLVTSYSYPDERTTIATMPGGATRTTTRYMDGRTKSVTGTSVVATYYDYTLESGLQCTTTYTGTENSPTYQKSCLNMLGQTVRTEQPGTGGQVLVTTNEYNNIGQLIRTSTTGMADTLYEYDSLGEQIRSGIDVDGNGTLNPGGVDRITESENRYRQLDGKWWQESRSFVYPEAGSADRVQTGRQLSLAGGNSGGLVNASRSYDILGNETVSETRLSASSHEEVTVVDSPDSTISAESVSVGGRLMESTDTSGIKTQYVYDALGRQTGVEDPRTGTAVTHYNEKGWVDYVRDAAGNKTEFEYDESTGRKTLERNALGKEVYFAYDTAGKLTHTWGDAVYPVQYVYDPVYGRRTEMHTYQDGDFAGDIFPAATGNVTTWHYDDASGMLLSKEDASGQQVAFTYENGRMKTRTWADNRITTYNYDPATGELLNIDYPDGTADVTFTYDRLGRKDTVVDGTGTRTFRYTENTLQLWAEEMTGVVNESIYRDYDRLGRGSEITIGPEYSVEYDYDDDSGRFESVGFGTETALYSYVPKSHLLAGVATSHVQTSYEYEPKRDLKTAVTNTTGATVVSRYAYQHDVLGRRISTQNTGSAFFVSGDAFNKYGYNDRNEVISSNRYLGTDQEDLSNEVTAEAESYQYDNIGNRQSAEAAGAGGQATYETNSLNQYEAINGASLNYDLDGNLLHSSYSTDTTYSYDAENRLVSATRDTMEIALVYDYLGRLVEKDLSDSGTLTEKRRYVYDGWNMIREQVLDAGDNVTATRHYVWGLDLSQGMQGAGGVGGLLAMTDGAGSYYYTYDANGNVGQMISAADSSIAARYEYDAFGGAIVADGAMADENPYRFSTKYYFASLGLYNFGHRLYEPKLGRWLNRDPMGEGGGNNLYSYIFNGSVNSFDVLGWMDWGVFAQSALDTLAEPFAIVHDSMLAGMIAGYHYFNPDAPIGDMEDMGFKSQTFQMQKQRLDSGMTLGEVAAVTTKDMVRQVATLGIYDFAKNIADASLAYHFGDISAEEYERQLSAAAGGYAAFAASASFMAKMSGIGFRGRGGTAPPEWARTSCFKKASWQGMVRAAAQKLKKLSGFKPDRTSAKATQRVLENIQRSRAAREASGFKEWSERLRTSSEPEAVPAPGRAVAVEDAVRHGDFQGPWRELPNENFKWGDYLREKNGTEPPETMTRPHAHHGVFKRGRPGRQRALVEAAQDIVKRRGGIDPIWGEDNLGWAPNRGHTTAVMESIVERLRALDAANGTPQQFQALLRTFIEEAAAR